MTFGEMKCKCWNWYAVSIEVLIATQSSLCAVAVALQKAPSPPLGLLRLSPASAADTGGGGRGGEGLEKTEKCIAAALFFCVTATAAEKKEKEIPRCKNYYCNMCFRLDHPNVVKLLEAYESKSYVYLVMEL